MKRAMRRKKTWQRQAAAITAAMMAMSVGGIAYAMPQGEVIRSGKGEITRQDKDMTVNQDSKRLAIDWSGFDIANDERVTFRQPDKDSVALNRVVGDAASVIDGTLSGNGHVYVINPNGVLFGKNASVDVGSLVASTARISDSDMTNFANADGITMAIPEDSSAKVINAGTIRAEGGLVVLHAAEVENSGTITNPEGTMALAAARNLSLSADTAGKINFTVDGALAKAKALNSGTLKADGGYLVMTARSAGDVMSTVVNNTGTMEAKTLRQNEKGEILLDGGDNGIVELNGTLDASGMEAGQSAGSIKAIGAETHVEDGATLHAIGAVDGGLIETSGDYLEIGDNVDIDAAGKTGKAGEWLLDPLDVVISASQPDNATAGDATDNTDGRSYSLGNVTNESRTSWVNSKTVSQLLSNGTNVRVESADINKAASISVNSTIEKTGTKEASFTLEAQRNITINKDITAKDGKLNVTLNSDTDGDAIGAVIINANIKTNGGNFTSGSGGTRHYDRYNRLIGAGDPSKGTVGTYFGNGGATGNRSVTTNGGAVNLYGDVAIGLNGGKLTIDTTKEDGTGGLVNITGTIESGNSYTLYYQGKAGWDDLVKKYAMEHGFETTATKYTGTDFKVIGKGDWYCIISEDGLSVKWYKATKGSSVIGTKQYINYTSSQVTINKTYTAEEYNRLSATDKSDMSHRIANSWEAAKWLAQNGTGGGSAVNDTYLATITSSLENSLAAPTGEIPLFVGGKGSGSPVSPIDSEHRDGYYWVTGPEGEAPGGKGTKFADNSGTPLQNYYAKWHTGDSETSHSTTTEPNNSGPYVTVGYGVTSNWDDVATSAGTTKGFVQEKNLAHSGLEVQAGSGRVDLKGNAGLSVGLKNLTINTTGNVTVGGGKSAAGTTYTGQIRTDEGVSIHGADVTVGDRITSINNGVDIQATGNIDVDGITAHEKINLTTTGGSGAIVLNHTHNDGALITKSTDNDAVIIDARGTDGSFKNLTTAKKAITTGEGGNWKVYSASPDRDTFGTNLNSETTARWHASSQVGNGLDAYAETENTNKYIFQTQPTLTVTADNKEKTYGETVELTAQEKAEFIGKDGNPHDVTGYTDAFQEVSEGGSIMDRYSGSYELSSAGQAASATRTNGDRQADDGEFAIYDINVDTHSLQGLEGYAVGTPNKGELTINRRTVVLNGSASQTYGDATLKNKNVYAETGTEGQGLTNGDKLDTSGVEYTISDSGAYAASKNAHVNGVTADAGTYNDELLFSNVHFTNNADANYAVTGNGDIIVDKHTITRDELGLEGSPLFTTVYGTKPDDLGKATFNAVNGDGSYELAITGTNALTGNGTGKVTNDVGSDYYTTVALSDALSKNYKFDNGETSKDFANTASVTKAKLTIESKGFNATYGDVEAVQQGLKNAATITGLTNGDGAATMIVDGTSDALITDENGKTRTNDVKQNGNDGYDINASIPDTLTNTINKNYEITNNLGEVVLKKRTAYLSTDDIHTVYGDGDTIYNKLAEDNLLHLTNLASWDTESNILKQIKAEASVKNNVSAFKLNADGTIATDDEGHRYTNDVRAYSITTSYINSKNYNIQRVRNENKNWGNIYVDPAKLVINVGNAETVYGTKFDESQYDYAYSTNKGESLVNGDTKESLLKDLGTIGYDNEAALDGTDGKWTAPVGDKYNLGFTQETKNTFKGLHNYDVTIVDGKAKVTPYTITEDDIIAANPHFTTVYGDTTTPVEVKIKGINGDEEISNTATTTAYIYDENGNPIKTEHVGDTYDIESTLTNSNYQFEGGKTSKVFDNTASVTKADLTVNVGNAETVYGTPFDTSKYDYAYSTETGKNLVNGDTKESLLKDLGTIGYDNEAALDGTDGKWTAAVGDNYTLGFTDETEAAFKALNDYDVKVVDGKAKVTPYTITSKDIVDGKPAFSTVYGTTTTPVEVAIKGVNGDATVDNTATTSAYEYGTEGTPVKTKDIGDKAYDITSVLTNKNYRFEDGSDTKLFANTASVTPAELTIQIGNASTIYGTKFDESQYGYNYASGITNGDTEATLDAALGGMNYTNDAALDGTNGKWTKDVGDYALKGEGVNGLKNYKVTYLDGTATVTPLNITEDNVNDFITNATYTTVYGSKADFGQAVFTGVNGDGTHDLSITGSSALTGNTEGVITKDAAENAYNTVVSLDGLSEQDKKNYGLEDTSSFTFDNSATVEKAALTVSRKGIETVYGTVKTDDGTMTTYTTLVNGDKNDIVIDNGNYGTAYNDELTKTNNVGKYNYKATLNSDSDVLRNYNVHDDGTNYVNITPLNITEDNVNDFITNATYTTVYGSKADFGQAVFTGVNGDGTRDLSITGSSALTGNTEGVITKDAAENAYNTVVSLDGLSEQDKKNYGLEDTSSFTFDNSATVEKADLTVSRKGIETVYGTVKKDPGDMTTYTTLVNGDTNDIVIDNGNYGTAYNDELTKTNNVGKYDYKATLNSASDVLRNYNVHDDGTNYVNITPYTITEQEVVNLDGSPLYTTKYGQKDAFGTATFTGVNGDGTYELAITDSSALATAGAGKVTQDVGKNIYDTTVKLSEAMNGNYQFADGATSKTFEKTASVTPAELTIKTKDVETEYGTVKTTTSEVEGLVNGDLPTGFIYDYGNYGGAYLDGNTKTNDVNTYHFGTTLSGAEFLKNYTITGGEADVKIDSKDVTFFVSGTGNTLTDVTYTVDPDIDAQLAYGEHVDADYTPGNDLGSNQYGVVAHINGTPIVTGDVAGNYRYNYGGLITLSPTVPTKPDIDPHNPSNLDGSGSWTSNMGNHGVPGVERVAGLASAELPFFKVEAGQVSHYGTYDVAADPDKVRLEPTGKRLPEPNQPKTQYREYTKALTTTDGTGMFRMVYDGSTFNITPVDDGALALMRMGDVKNNVELSAEALHAGFSEMGILLEDLDGVYVHFDRMA